MISRDLSARDPLLERLEKFHGPENEHLGSYLDEFLEDVAAEPEPQPTLDELKAYIAEPIRDRFGVLRKIMRAACAHFDLTEDEMLGQKRTGPVVHARFIASYVARALTDHSFPKIAQAFRRDHTSIINGYYQIADKVAAGDEATIRDVAAVKKLVERS